MNLLFHYQTSLCCVLYSKKFTMSSHGMAVLDISRNLEISQISLTLFSHSYMQCNYCYLVLFNLLLHLNDTTKELMLSHFSYQQFSTWFNHNYLNRKTLGCQWVSSFTFGTEFMTRYIWEFKRSSTNFMSMMNGI